MEDSNIFNIIGDRDIVFLDLETTGIDIKLDRIVEFGGKKYKKDGTIEELHHYINPTIKVTDEALAVHGLSDEFLSNYPTFSEIYDTIFDFIDGCDLGGYNIVKYDIPILFEEFTRCDKFIDIFNINVIDSYNLLNKYEPRKLGDTYRRFFDKEMKSAHTTIGDIDATVEIFNKQIEEYGLVNNNPKFISNKVRSNDKEERFLDYDSWFLSRNGEIYFNKGSLRGKRIKEHKDQLMWIYNNTKFQNNVRFVAKQLFKKYFNNE